MPVAEPWDDGGLWAAVRPLTGWPQANEDMMATLGQAWTNAGLDGLHSSQPSLAGLDTWSDDTGRDYHAKAGALLSRASEASELMKRLGWLATQYGEDIGHTKTEIAKVINANSGYYFRSTFPLTSWAYDPGTSQRIVTTLASSINAFIDAMADRIAARGATGADLPRPQFVPSELPDQPVASDAAVPGDPRRPADSPANNPPGVKPGWSSRTADNGQGTVYQDPGSSGNANMVRIMEPNSQYPNGYVRFYNKHGQPVGLDGKPGPNSATHIPRAADGSYSLPEGW